MHLGLQESPDLCVRFKAKPDCHMVRPALKYHTLILFLRGAFFHVALHFKFVIFGNLLDVLLPFASPPGRHVLAIAA